MAIERIALITVHASPLASPGSGKVGGMNVYIRELVCELGRRGIAVDVFTRRQSTDTPEINDSLGSNVRVIHVLAGSLQVLPPDETYPHLSQFTAGVIAFATRFDLSYDLIYSHYWLSGWVAHKLNEVWGIPTVHMFHTLGQMKNRIIPGRSNLLPDVRVNVETSITRWATRLIAATPAEQLQLLWLYRADRRRIAIVPPGVDTDRFHPLPRWEAAAALRQPDDSHLLLFVGRLEPLKGVDTIVHALASLRDTHPVLFKCVRFMIVGGDLADPLDREFARLRQLVHELALDRQVEFVGAKGQELLPYYYALASALLMPSDYESFGMVALEAMASGTPVIASEVGGLAFLVQDGVTGFLVPVREPQVLADRIARLLVNPALLEAMRSAAVQVAEQYTWPVIVDRLLVVFEEARADQSISLRRR